MNKRVKFFGWLVLLVALVGPLATPAPTRAQRGNVSEDNCAVTPFDIAGQGHFTIGGSGGGTLPAGVTRDQVVDPTDPALQIVKTIGPQPVAILVIDDFFDYSDEAAHGRLVTDLLIRMIRGSAVYSAAPQKVATEPFVVWAWEPRGYGRLIVIEVDTRDYNTDTLRDVVEQAVRLAQNDYKINRVVFNMSFVLIPCSTPDYDVKAIKASRVRGETQRATPLLPEVARARDIQLPAPALEARAVLAESLADRASTRQAAGVLVQYAQQTATREGRGGTPLDPLHDYIKSLTGQGQYWNVRGSTIAVAVGSAGNFGRRLDSFLPAAWPEVMSASASLGQTDAWEGSNKGQVILPGGLFPTGKDLYLIGTSFSAPVLSMNTAFYLTGDPVCGDPPLALDLRRFTDPAMPDVINGRCSPPFALGDALAAQ